MSGARKVVLLVEDEPLIAMVAGEIMEDLGYEVLDASTKRGALAVLAAERRITLLFTDIDLADGSSGIELAREFAQLCPGIPIVVTSGRFQPIGMPPGARFLPKPYSDQDVAEAILPTSGMNRRRHEMQPAVL